MSDFILRNTKGSELTFNELDGNQSILLTSASTAYRSSSISGSTLKLFSNTSTGSVSSITHSLEIVSSSYAISASYAVSASVEILTEVSSSHAQQADNANSASHAEWADNGVISASIDGTHGHKIDFTRGDGTTFELEIETGSSTDTRDYISNITYTNGDLNFTGEGDAYNSTVDLGVVISSSRHWQEVVKNANILHPTTASLVHEKLRLAELTGSLITLVDSASHTEFADSASAALYTVSGSSTLYAVSASHAINATKYVQTAAIDGTHAHKIDFTRGDGTTFELEIDTGSAGGSTDYISNVSISKVNGGRTYSFVFTGQGNAFNATETLNLNSGIISGSTLSSLTQGTVRQTLDGPGGLPAEIDIVDLTKDGSPTFGGITISGSTIFGSSSTSFTHEFTGSTSIDGTLQLGGGDAIGNDITGAFWQGYQISSSKIDFNFEYGYPSLNNEINKKFEKATFDNTTVELTIHNNTGSTVLSTIDDRITGLLNATSSYVDLTGTINANEFAQFHDSDTLKALTAAEMRAALDLEVGTDVLAEQTIGIADDNLLEVDDADAEDNDYAKFTANGLEGRSYAEVKTDLGLSTTDDVTFASGSFKGLTFAGNINISDYYGGWQGQVISASKVDIDVSGFVDTSGTPVDNDFAKFTDANTIEGRSYSEVRSDLSLSTTDDVTFASGSFKGLTVEGDITANSIITNYVTQSVSFATGSNKFGDELSDKHEFTGSVEISGALHLGGGDAIGNDITGAYWEGYVISASKVEGLDGYITSVTAGNGLTGGGSSGDVEVEVGQGDGITVSANDVAVDNTVLRTTGDDVISSSAQIDHDSTTNFVAGEHFLQSAITTVGTVTTGNITGILPGGIPSGSAAEARAQIGAGTGDGTVDTSGTPVDNDFAKFTDSNTIEGRSYSEVRSDLGLVIGTDVLAQQAIGIADDNLLEVDDADAADNDYAKFTANGLEGRSYSEVRSDLGLGTIYSKNSTTSVTNGSTDIPDGNAVYDHVTTRLSGYVNKTGTPVNQQIPIFTDADTISGSSHLRMHVNSGYPQFGGLIVGDGPDSNLYIGAAIEPSSTDVGIRLHSTASGDFYFDFQGDATQTLYFRDYDGAGNSPTKFTFDFQNSDFATTTGSFSGNVTANNFITTSDRELKKDIKPVKDGLETLKKFVSYEYELDGKKDAGFIAQEVQESLPYAVHTKKDGYLALDTKPIIAHIHKAILEIDQRLSDIEEKLK